MTNVSLSASHIGRYRIIVTTNFLERKENINAR